MAMTVVKLTVMVMEVTVVKETRIPLTTGNEKHPHHRMVEPTGGMLRARGLAFRTATSGDVGAAVKEARIILTTGWWSRLEGCSEREA